MDENFSLTKFPTATSTSASGAGALWSNPTRITAADASSATVNFIAGGDYGARITGTTFDFATIPSYAVIDGVKVFISGSNFSCYGDVSLNVSGSSIKGIGNLNQNYGSSTDLWGKTSISVAEIQAITASVVTGDVSGGDGSAGIDYITITVYWHVPPAEVPKRYIYKVFSVDNTYKGTLQNITSEFSYSQDINVAGSQLNFSVGITPDTASQAITTIDDETGTPIQDENGNDLYTERAIDVIGNDANTILIQNGNRIKVYEVGYYYPNGKLVFKGQINRYSAPYGNETSDDNINVTALSDGADLGYYLLTGGGTIDVTNASSNATVTSYDDTNSGKGAGWNKYGQSWLTGAVTTLAQIGVAVNTGGVNETISVKVYSDSSFSVLIGTATQTVNCVVATEYTFSFTPIITVAAATTYYFLVQPQTNGSSLVVSTSTINPYANGQMYNSNYSGGSGGGTFVPVAGNDIWFKTYSGGTSTDVTYTAQDPATIALDMLSRYNATGGIITGSTSTIPTTGVTATYSFRLTTILDGIQKCRDLSPANWYWYTDVATSILTFKSTATTAAYTFVKGRHLNHLTLTASIEDVVNRLMFTGGPTAGVNLYTQYSDITSIASYGPRTDKKSDNRVTLSATAALIGGAFITSRKDEKYQTQVVIPARTMDITLPHVGDVVGFSGFGNFIDRLVLQIVRLEYAPNKITLMLGIMPPRNTTTLAQAVNDIEALQTVANPATPS